MVGASLVVLVSNCLQLCFRSVRALSVCLSGRVQNPNEQRMLRKQSTRTAAAICPHVPNRRTPFCFFVATGNRGSQCFADADADRFLFFCGSSDW